MLVLLFSLLSIQALAAKQGGLFFGGADPNPVPLKTVQAKVSVVDFLSQVELIQSFDTAGFPQAAIEAIYKFPLFEKVAVIGFTAQIGDKTLIGISKQKDTAKQEYQEAVEKGHSAFLLESDDPETFTAWLGNIPTNTQVKITVRYVSELSMVGDAWQFILPTTIAPRYGEALPKCPEKADIPANEEYGLSMYVSVEASDKILGLVSPTHEIEANHEETQGYIKFSSAQVAMDRDLVLNIKTARSMPAAVWVEESSHFKTNDDKNSYAAMLSFEAPPVTQDTQKGEIEIIFVVDTSGSMSERIEQTKQAVTSALKQLLETPAEGFTFNVYRFSSDYTRAFYSSKTVNKASIDDAITFVRTFEANGGTELHYCLQEILNSQPKNHREILILTDGEISRPDTTINMVNQNNHHTRVFTIGIGESVSHYLVNGLARAGKGTSELVIPSGMNSKEIEVVVKRQLSRLISPPQSIKSIQWGNQRPLVRAPFSDVVTRDGLNLAFVILDAPPQGDIIINIEPGNQQIVINANDIGYLKGSDLIHQLFAKKRISDLEEGRVDFEDKQKTNKEIASLGVKYNLASTQTSFIVVDEASKTEDPRMRTVVPQHTPHGEGGYLFSSAQKRADHPLAGLANMFQADAFEAPKASGYSAQEMVVEAEQPSIPIPVVEEERKEELVRDPLLDEFFREPEPRTVLAMGVMSTSPDAAELPADKIFSDGYLSVVIGMNEPLPTTKSIMCNTSVDGQETMVIVVYQGASKSVKKDIRMATLSLSGIPPGPKGMYQAEVTIEINTEGVVITATLDTKSDKGIITTTTIVTEAPPDGFPDDDDIMDRLFNSDLEIKKHVNKVETPEKKEL